MTSISKSWSVRHVGSMRASRLSDIATLKHLESDTTAASPCMHLYIDTPQPTTHTQVAGESGHGKTSFINNLFLSYTAGREVKPHDGTSTRVEDFLAKCVVKIQRRLLCGCGCVGVGVWVCIL